ncbi:hypothetical protein [Paractinoplanes ferrugineus]|uniref:hypothetical protein n=1 Tax=Paractinoplanes ferrugineus TaxID=113564 RepID=UPI0019406F91|nr:hypothetical protein [Actinoplanes ferrugineus]
MTPPHSARPGPARPGPARLGPARLGSARAHRTGRAGFDQAARRGGCPRRIVAGRETGPRVDLESGELEVVLPAECGRPVRS